MELDSHALIVCLSAVMLSVLTQREYIGLVCRMLYSYVILLQVFNLLGLRQDFSIFFYVAPSNVHEGTANSVEI